MGVGVKSGQWRQWRARALMVLTILGVSTIGIAQVILAPSTATCATSVDGSFVGVPNPLQVPQVTVGGVGATLPAGTYFVMIAYVDGSSNVTLPSPEVQYQVFSGQSIAVSAPANGPPQGAVTMNVYIGTASNAETLQGNVPVASTYTQSVPLASGAAIPTVNSTVCKIIANDAGWPANTGYQTTVTAPNGATYPGYPMLWQLNGPGGTINIANGLPIYNGSVQFPSPILATPYGHAPQSISGNLSLGGYSLTVGRINASGSSFIQGNGAPALTIEGDAAGDDILDAENSNATVVAGIDSAGDVFSSGALKLSSAQTSVNCSTSGSVVFSEPLQGASDKKVLIRLVACVGTASYTYPTAFLNTPDIFAGAAVSSGLVTAHSTTAVTVTGSTSTGVIVLENY